MPRRQSSRSVRSVVVALVASVVGQGTTGTSRGSMLSEHGREALAGGDERRLIVSRRSKRSRIGVLCAALLCSGPFLFHAPASAGLGAYHTAVGSGAEYEPGACASTRFFCGAAYGDTFSIDASDKPGAYGWMRLNDVDIPLNCITITHEDGHTVYASGTGTDGKVYFATVIVPITAGSFIIGNYPGSRPCGGMGYWDASGYGTFVISGHL
jgi:hypothetical protein